VCTNPLKTAEAISISEKECCSSLPPVKPKGGEIFSYLFIFILFSLTPKGKVSTEGKAYRRVTYKNKQNKQTNN